MGSFTNKGDYSEGDLEFEQTPKLSLAAGYSYNDRAVRTQGQLGPELFGDRDITTFIADMILKYKGWAVMGEYFDRQAMDPITANEEGDISYVRTGIGINGQLSRAFRSGYEVVGRYTTVQPGEEIRDLARRNDEVLLGGTKYLNGHRIKLQL
ncbi:MAG: porin, partial [Bacteroidota bacterium]|nr:porin [Bacteroidota bacterium]